MPRAGRKHGRGAQSAGDDRDLSKGTNLSRPQKRKSPGHTNKSEQADAISKTTKATDPEVEDGGGGGGSRGGADGDGGGGSSNASPLSSLSDGQFQNDDSPVHAAKRPRVASPRSDSESDSDQDMEFEDVQPLMPPPRPREPVVSGDLELTLRVDNRISLTSSSTGRGRGPTKLARQTRSATHCVHVQYLMWHNAVRNGWLCDSEVQAIMMSHLTPRLWDEIERWRGGGGGGGDGGAVDDNDSPMPTRRAAPRKKKQQSPVRTRPKQRTERSTRSGVQAASATADQPDGDADSDESSRPDPLLRLMQVLVPWWKQRFHVTAPGLRKWGYMDLRRLDSLIKEHARDPSNPARLGERIESLDALRERAQRCDGSRDVGSQLFTALLRSIGLEARMVASLQPVGFGWSKMEDAAEEEQHLEEKKEGKEEEGEREEGEREAEGKEEGEDEDEGQEDEEAAVEAGANEEAYLDPTTPTTRRSRRRNIDPPPKFDADLDFPHYWTEVLSPATQRYIAVDPLVKKLVASRRDLLDTMEPRGQKAERARQVIAYVIAFSSDGTGKDVTVRYLRAQAFPGRTRGVRFPADKVPIYNRHGQVKGHQLVDWFRSSVMAGYRRGSWQHPATAPDQLEDETDLKAGDAEKKLVKAGEETLQYYKTSAEFVLERFLKREEALLAGAKPVGTFNNRGRGPEEVYRRRDVVQVRSAETWHKQGREPGPAEVPLKRVPYRAATLNRKREIFEAERASGQKVLQGLYSREQTDWIVPAPVRHGVIPKNEYGNIDLFVPNMLPRGAAHVPRRAAARACRRLRVDFAEAVVDFEFGHRMAVPVIHGVVVAEEHRDAVLEEIAKDEAERRRREDEKRRAQVLAAWRRLLMGLRIGERIRRDYGEAAAEDGVRHIFGRRRVEAAGGAGGGGSGGGGGDAELEAVIAEAGGGFLPEGFEEEEGGEGGGRNEGGGGRRGPAAVRPDFFSAAEESDGDGDLVVEHGDPS